MHIAIHMMLRGVCRWSRQLTLAPSQADSLNALKFY